MSCQDIRDDLEALHDGELAAAATERVTAHLEACAPCRGLLASLRDLRSLFDAHGRSPVPARLRDRILTEAAPTRSLGSWLMPRLAAAGLGGLLVGGALWFGRNPAPETAREPIARYFRATNVSTTPGELHSLRGRPENKVLAWARQERNK